MTLALAASLLLTCGDEHHSSVSPAVSDSPETPTAEAKQALGLALARFPVDEPGKQPVPLPAALEFLVPSASGPWEVVAIEDPQSNVFHKAMSFPGPAGEAWLVARPR